MINLYFLLFLTVSGKNDDYLELDTVTGDYVEKWEFDGDDGNLNFKKGILMNQGDIQGESQDNDQLRNTMAEPYRTWKSELAYSFFL